MTVDKTSGIIHNLPGTIAGNKNIKRPEDVYKAASGASEDTHTLKVGDKVEISNEARDLQKKLSDLKAEIKMMPDTREENSSRCHDWRFKMQQKTYYLLHPHQSLLLNCEGIWDISIHNGSKSDCKFFHMHCNMQNKFPEIFSTES